MTSAERIAAGAIQQTLAQPGWGERYPFPTIAERDELAAAVVGALREGNLLAEPVQPEPPAVADPGVCPLGTIPMWEPQNGHQR